MRSFMKSCIGILLGLLLSSQAWAAFPSVVARNTATANSSVLPVILPVGSASGNLVVILLQAHTITTTWTQTGGTTGWAELYDSNGQAFYYKQIGGGEANPSFTASVSERLGASALTITGHADPAIRTPEASTAVLGGPSTTPDPPSLTPTGGAKDYLWIAVDGNLYNYTVNAAPLNYANLNAFASGAGPNGTTGATAERQLNASSENPGTFTIGGSINWITNTIAIHPAAAARRIMLVE